MYILSVNTWFQTLMRQFFFGIDSVVYDFISVVYNLLISIARTSVLTQADIESISSRIYMLLAVFMIFKVTFSLIMYVVNPDDFSDKTKGVAKLGTNVIISLALLVLTPYIFSYAFRLQSMVLNNNSLATLIFGTESQNSQETVKDSSFLNTAGDEIAFITLSPFYVPNVSIEDIRENCTNFMTYETDENSVIKNVFKSECSGLGASGNEQNSNDKSTMASLLEKEQKVYLYDYVTGVERHNLNLMFKQDLVVATTDKAGETTFVMQYRYIISTVVGVLVALILITFCMDIALRSVKLAFLQLIAPIPIISYVDPKSGKDGLFKKWYQMCFKTYASLFVRLLALYFAIYIIQRVGKMVDIIDGSYVTNLFVKIFIIIGALMFAKQLPKILEGLGIKLDGDGKFTLNPLKKFEENAMGGKNITGMARGALAGTAGALTGAGIARGLTGAWRGLKDGKGWTESGKATAEMNRKMRQAKLNGSTFTGRLGAKVAGATGFMSRSEAIAREKTQTQNEIDKIDDKIKAIEEQKNRIKGSSSYIKRQKDLKGNKAFADSIKAMEDRAKSEIEQGNSDVGKEYLRKKAYYDDLKQNGVLDSNGNRRNATAQELATAEFEMKDYLANSGMKEYMTKAIAGQIDDKTFDNLKENAKQAATNIGKALAQTGNDIHSQLGATKGEIGRLQREGNDDDRKLAEYDDLIAKHNEEKSPYNDRIRELNKEETKAKANEDVIK